MKFCYDPEDYLALVKDAIELEAFQVVQVHGLMDNELERVKSFDGRLSLTLQQTSKLRFPISEARNVYNDENMHCGSQFARQVAAAAQVWQGCKYCATFTSPSPP